VFLMATKVAIVEALRAVYDDYALDEARPRRVDIEYPQDEEDWPAILVQFRLAGPVQWTGIYPDVLAPLEEPPEAGTPWEKVRQGLFEGQVELQVLATTSGERDRIYDGLVKLVLMGQKRSDTARFFDRIENHDLIGMTVAKSTVQEVGSTVGPGTPWSEEVLTYEATIRFGLVGVFYADEFTEEILPIEKILFYFYREGEAVPGDADGKGPWSESGW
jgi:hypothetical protein